jgi:hypothetical protein
MTVNPVPDILLPANPSQDAVVLRNQVLALSRAATHRKTFTMNAIYANFEMGSAAVTLFSHADWDDVKSSRSLKNLMDKYVVSLLHVPGLVFPDILFRHGLLVNNPTFFQQFGSNDGKDFFFDLRLTSQLMVAISPILLFLPRRLSSKKFRREHLIHVSGYVSLSLHIHMTVNISGCTHPW